MKDYSLRLTDHHNHNHSNYLVCDRANMQSVTVRKVVKLQLNYCNALVIKWIYNIVPCSEGRTRDVHSSSLLIDVYALFSTLVSDGRLQWPRLRNSWTLFAWTEQVNLFNHLVRKVMLRVVVLRVLFSFADMRLPHSGRWFVLSVVVFTLSWCRSINTIPAS